MPLPKRMTRAQMAQLSPQERNRILEEHQKLQSDRSLWDRRRMDETPGALATGTTVVPVAVNDGLAKGTSPREIRALRQRQRKDSGFINDGTDDDAPSDYTGDSDEDRPKRGIILMDWDST
jgi:hypothetical protein